MNITAIFTEMMSHGLAWRAGWALVHFVWQGFAVALLLAGVLWLLRKRSAGARYIAGCAAMALLVILPVATAWQVSPPVAAPESHAKPVVSPAPYRPVETAIDEINLPIAPLEATPIVATAIPLRHRVAGAIEPMLPHMLACWLGGVILLSIWRGAGWIGLRRLRNVGIEPVGRDIAAAFASLARRMGVSRPVRLLKSSLATVPAVIGWFRPVVLVPAAALAELSPQQLQAILAHELAHVRRWDYLVNLAQTVVETLGFYHPAVWWVSARIRFERENCCDDAATAACGDQLTYARSLAALEQLRHARPALAVAATGGSLLARIKRLLETPTEGTTGSSRPFVAALMLAALAVGMCVGLRPAGGAGGGNPSTRPAEKALLAKVRAIVAKNEALLSNVKMDYSVRLNRSGNPRLGEGVSFGGRRMSGKPFAHLEGMWACSGMKQYYQTDYYDQSGKLVSRQQLATNGDTTREIRRQNGEPTVYEVTNAEHFRHPGPPTTPRAFLGMRPAEWNLSLCDVLTLWKADVHEQRQTIEGTECYVVDLTMATSDGNPATFWIDSQRGLPVKIEYYENDRSPENGGRILATILTTQKHLLGNGAWMPVKGTRTVFFNDGPSVASMEVETKSITVRPQDIPQTLFDLPFPEGAEVESPQVLIQASFIEVACGQDPVFRNWLRENLDSDFQPSGAFGKFLDEKDTSRLLAAVKSIGKARVLSRPLVLIRSGKQGQVSVGHHVPVKLPIAGKPGETRLAYMDQGVQLEIEPTISDDRERILLKLRASAEEWGHFDPAFLERAEADIGHTTAVPTPKRVLVRLKPLPRRRLTAWKETLDGKTGKKSWEVVSESAKDQRPPSKLSYVLVTPRVVAQQEGHAAGSVTRPVVKRRVSIDSPVTRKNHRICIQVYEIRDLMVHIPDFSMPPSVKRVSESERKVDKRARSKQRADAGEREAQALVKLIKETVDPDSWEAGTASISLLNKRLVIAQTASGHDQIAKLVEHLRRERALHVSAEARFISIASEYEPQLRTFLAEKLGDDFQADGLFGKSLSDAEVDMLIRQVQRDKGTKMLTSPRLTVFSGKKAHVTVHTDQRTALPVVGQPGRSQDVSLSSGTSLEIAPTVSGDRKRTTTEIHPRTTEYKISELGQPVRLIEAERVRTVTTPDGQTILLRLDPAAMKVIGVKEVTDPQTNKKEFEPVKEPVADAPPPKTITYMLLKQTVLGKTAKLIEALGGVPWP